MALQSILGVIISACMAGIFFAKFTVPTNRGETVVFSEFTSSVVGSRGLISTLNSGYQHFVTQLTPFAGRRALISLRDGALCLLVRVGDLRQSHLLECHVSAHFLHKRKTAEGEVRDFMFISVATIL